jgi:anion-transporting  ArsA/GET3 family ATPase
MDPAQFLTSSRVLIVAGKGGVGKTTVTAALASMASSSGLRTLIVEIEGKSGLSGLFGHSRALTYNEEELVPPGGGQGGVKARTLTPDDALVEYLVDHGMKRVSKRLAASGALDVVATAVPGLRDILVLGKVKSLEKGGSADLIVLDAPAAGHAVTFLTSARGLMDAFRVGPIRSQAVEVLDLLADPRRCQVMLVTLPEETPVNEVVETAFNIEDRVGVSLAPVVVNGIYPVIETAGPGDSGASAGPAPEGAEALERAGAFRRSRQDLQAEQIERLQHALPLAQLRLPYLFSTDLGPAETARLATSLHDAVRALPDLRRT